MKGTQTNLVLVSWAVTLAVSLLPNILFKELTGSLPGWLFWIKISLCGGCLLLGWLWKPLRALGPYFAVILLVNLLSWGVDQVYTHLHYTTWFAGTPSFAQSLFAVQIPRATTGGLLVLILLILTGSSARFFFVPGKFDAPAAPIPFILTRPPSWQILGPAIAAAMSLGLA